MGQTGRGIIYPSGDVLHPSKEWWAQLATTTDAAIGDAEAAASFVKGAIAEGTDLNTITTAGVYSVATNAIGESLVNGPGLGAGTVLVTRTLNGFVSQQYITIGNATTVWLRSVVSVGSGTWSSWRDMRADPITVLTSGSDLNALRTPGLYVAETAGVAASLLNAPDALPGVLEVLQVSPVLTVQRWSSTLGSGSMFFRATTSASTGNWTGWRNLFSGATTVTDAGPYRHVDLVSRARVRRGGRIGTGGKPVVALRFDHHLDAFEAKVLPLLKQYQLPWAQAINPQNLGTGDDNMTWAELQTMCLDHGGEVWNHGGNHGNATTPQALQEQIVDSLTTLRTNLPGLAVEGWCPPGLAAGAYMGASPFATTAQNTETAAGQLIMGNHAFVAGYAPGQYRVLDPTAQPIGAPHITIDDAAPSSITSALNTAIARGVGVAFMLHANYLDEAGYLTTAQLAAFLADIAARRDAGTLVVLSYSGLWLADSDTARRHDVAPPTQAPVAVPGSTAHVVQITQYRQDQHLGASREVLVDVEAGAATTLTVQVGAGEVSTHNVPAGVSRVRRVVTLPADASANIPVTVTPAAGVTVNRVSVLAV
ncbi:polysaccharide deacetylase family protein [Cellulosimicrobium sp. I38E]|uniref:polysaccharide deacetylase family protein n=1 Tax=Cellulosimicrobium sp. I38E TaxID=1393139 RepID=UPI0007B29B0C|nr:polysaccharide deacetylase family protein [Cellulosimicrobium sp. I38E]KZM78407.1 hypothetical protein A0J59_13840 [Cellulosimicrobium sp. I38E]